MSMTYVTRSHKKGVKSLGPIRAAGKEVKDNHYVLHLTPATPTGPSLRYGLGSGIKLNSILWTFLLCQYLKNEKNRLKIPFVRTGHIIK